MTAEQDLMKGLPERVARVLDTDLLFICGAAKSGTTWIQAALDAHPEVAARGEGHFINQLGEILKSSLNQYNKVIDQKNRDLFGGLPPFPLMGNGAFLHLLRECIALQMGAYATAEGIKVIAEKSPDNIRRLPVLAGLFPKAKFLHVIRDGRDVAISGWHHNMRLSEVETNRRFGSLPQYADRIARSWSAQVQAGQAFAEAEPKRCLEIKYEDLLDDFDETFKSLLTFLKVKKSAKIIEACRDASTFETLAQGRQPGQPDPKSFFRVGTKGQWKKELDKETQAKFKEIAGPLMKRLGYK